MKKIEAVIRTSKFDEVKEALHAAGVDFFTLSDVKGVGSQRRKAIYRGTEYDLGTIARIKLEIVCSKNYDQVIQSIVDAAKTGEVGDGKIFVYEIDQVVRIRTGESNEAAL